MLNQMESFEFEEAKKAFLVAISSALMHDEKPGVSNLKAVFKGMKYLDNDKKTACDQAFREKFVEDSLHFSTSSFEKLLNLSVESTVADLCSPSLPIVLLTDAFDVLPIGVCEEIFCFVEAKVSTWKQELFFNSCKNSLLRLCNDLLRRLSRSQNTVFCGRILLFLAKFFPFSERSGLNVVSEFNLDNVTTFGIKDENASPDISLDEKDGTEEKNVHADYNLYKKFWSLQDFFRNPNQCYSKVPWKTFCSYTNDVLAAFSTIKLDGRRQQKQEEQMDVIMSGETETSDSEKATRVQQYFAKYLTSQKLLELQLADSNFRRYVLLQFLIMFQYLDAPVKFKQEAQKLAEEQTSWVGEATDRVYRLLEDTPPDGATFAKAVHHILKREELWSNWKNEGCPEFRPLVAVPSRSEEIFNESSSGEKSTAVVSNRGRRLKRTLGEQMKEAAKKNKCVIGNMELTRLWNLCPDNMAACRSKERDFLPSLEKYFEEAIEQLDPSIESQYKRINDANFGWRALRLLARRSLHFFTHGNSPITRLPDYLESHVKKMAKDSQIKSSSTMTNMKQDTTDEAGMEQMEQEAESETAAASEMEGTSSAASEETGKTEESDCEQNRNKKPVLCSMEQLTLLAKQLGSDWKILAPKLGFKSDEIEYFESENDSVELQARTMFQIWLENEPDATPENLLYTLEGLGLQQTAQGILS